MRNLYDFSDASRHCLYLSCTLQHNGGTGAAAHNCIRYLPRPSLLRQWRATLPTTSFYGFPAKMIGIDCITGGYGHTSTWHSQQFAKRPAVFAAGCWSAVLQFYQYF